MLSIAELGLAAAGFASSLGCLFPMLACPYPLFANVTWRVRQINKTRNVGASEGNDGIENGDGVIGTR